MRGRRERCCAFLDDSMKEMGEARGPPNYLPSYLTWDCPPNEVRISLATSQNSPKQGEVLGAAEHV